MADPIVVPRRKEDLFEPNGEPTLRFIKWMELVTDGGNETTTTVEVISEDAIINRALLTRPAQLSNLQVQIDDSSDRIETNEIDLATRPRMSDLFKANQRIDELIDELIKEIRAIAPDTELENKVLCVQVETLKQIKLLNLRTEEALETQLDEDDL